MSLKRENLLGKRFGKLTVISEAPSRIRTSGSKTYYWNCVCDCGSEKAIQAQKLKSGQQSCGCVRKSKLPFGESFLNKLLYNYKKDAKQRGFSFCLSKKVFLKLVKNCCVYCGEPPSIRQKQQNFNGIVAVNGIDRVNPKLGYIITNVVPCCPKCNVAKSDMTVEEFRLWITKVYKFFLET